MKTAAALRRLVSTCTGCEAGAMSYDAVVIGAGPNGLVAAITLTRAGRRVCVLEAHDRVGGGSRSAALTEPGFVHDVCAAIHSFGVLSPAFRDLPLAEHGLEWIEPDVPLAHPLDGGRVAVAYRSVDETSEALGSICLQGGRLKSGCGCVVVGEENSAAAILLGILCVLLPFAFILFRRVRRKTA